jgi:ketosteroid isomerase-like protein
MCAHRAGWGPPTIVRMPDRYAERQAAREELVRRAMDLFNAGEREIREEFADPECEIRSAMTGSVYRGYHGVRRWMQEIDEQFETWRTWPEEFVPASGNRLLVLGATHLRGRESGIEFEAPLAWLFEFRSDRILRMTTFAAHDEGRRAVDWD